MIFESINFYGFRNIVNDEIRLSGKNIYLVGENGQGKTNFLESIYLLCVGSSFRTKNDSLFIKSGSKDMSISGFFLEDNIKRNIKLKIEGGRKKISIDDKNIRDRKQLLSDFSCIAFTHDDINFVTGPPAMRRLFINQTISLFDGLYIDTLRTYNRLLKIRNIILKERKTEILDVYDLQLAESGIEIQKKRNEIIKSFNSVFSNLYRNISGYDIDILIRYSPSWKLSEDYSSEDVLKIIRENRKMDLNYGTSTSGPHRDRIGFCSDGRNYSSTASTGQIRLISLVLRAAQAFFSLEKSGKKPILLLDDVLLEMDLKKRQRFLDYIPDYSQAFFTFLPDEGLINNRNNGNIYLVKNGSITKEG